MSNVVLLSTVVRPAPAPRPIDSYRASPHVYTFGEICAFFGLLGDTGVRQIYSTARRVAYVRAVHARQQFPAPFPQLRGELLKEGLDAIDARARWDRRAVDAWFEGQLPPGALQAAATAARSRDEDALDANAAAMAAVGRGARA